jgi:Ulp1 family protease
VPHQDNSKDCGCFTVYFARKFLQDPVATLGIIKVLLFIFSKRSLLIYDCQTQYPSAADGMAAWGLENADLTFIRQEMKSLLLKYVSGGEASVEYQ